MKIMTLLFLSTLIRLHILRFLETHNTLSCVGYILEVIHVVLEGSLLYSATTV